MDGRIPILTADAEPNKCPICGRSIPQDQETCKGHCKKAHIPTPEEIEEICSNLRKKKRKNPRDGESLEPHVQFNNTVNNINSYAHQRKDYLLWEDVEPTVKTDQEPNRKQRDV